MLDVDVALLRGRADDVCNQLKADLHSKTHELSIVQNKASTLKVACVIDLTPLFIAAVWVSELCNLNRVL